MAVIGFAGSFFWARRVGGFGTTTSLTWGAVLGTLGPRTYVSSMCEGSMPSMSGAKNIVSLLLLSESHFLLKGMVLTL